jgi:hypothetical protein
VKTPAATATRVVTLVAALAALLVLAAPAAAAKSCGRAVIDDWYDDGRVDGTYALHCYDDAIESLPPDVRDYSSAKEDIQRALQARMRGEDAPPSSGDPSQDPSPQPEEPDETVPSSDDDPETETTGTPGAGPTDGDDGSLEAAPTAESESASSVPIPLLVLAGLALLLVLGGITGYLIRRYQARRIPRTTA